MQRHHAFWLMVLVLWVAAALRLPDLAVIPPGVHYDEAANGILAAEIGLAGYRPVFITSYTGKEVLFFYLAGAMARLLGPGAFALRLTAAFVGLLTIAVTYRLGCTLLRRRQLALLAAALLAVSFWHLLLSRLGFRAITQPLLQGLTILGLWRGLRAAAQPGRRTWPWVVLSGTALGLTAYTYLAARIFPLLLLPALLLLLIRRESRRFLLLSGGLAGVVLLPLLRFFLANPDAFWVRIDQVGPDATQSLWHSFGQSLAMLVWRGDPYWRFNLPDRPLFGPFWGLCLLLGAGWLLTAWRRQTPRQRASRLLLLLNPLIMILPTALATNEILPSNLRAVGLMPLIFFLPAVGLGRSLDWLGRRWPRLTAAPALFQLLVLVALAAGGAGSGRAYFQEWAGRADVFYETDADLTAVAAYLDETGAAGPTYLAALHYRHPAIAYQSAVYDALKWLPQSEAIVFPAAGPARYIYPHSSPAPAWLTAYLPPAAANGPVGPDGQPTFTVYTLNSAPAVNLRNPVTENFSGRVTLLGYELSGAGAGQDLTATLLWRIDAPPPENYLPFLHLEDAAGRRWAQLESYAYPGEQWAAGETVLQQLRLTIPPGTPPGPYQLRFGFFDPDNGAQLVRLDEAGRYAGAAFVIEPVYVVPGGIPDNLPAPPAALNQVPLPGLALIGYEPPAAVIQTGSALSLALWWTATEPPGDLVTRLELIAPDGSGRILLNTQPVYDTYPYAEWQTPLFLIDPIEAAVPVNFPAGDYQLQLRLLRANGETVLTQPLGPLRVEATERLFTPPPLTHRLPARFGSEIELVGYDLEPAGDQTYTLRLVWRAAQAPLANYTVFVHLLNTDGSCCAWQQDTWPQQGAYATSRWLPDEVVVDEYVIQLPPELPAGEYGLEIGLYLAASGHRLQVTTPNRPDDDALFLAPLRR